MRSRIKRLVVKVALLSLIVNGVLLLAKSREQGALGSHDYLMAAASFATTLVVIAGIAFLYLRFAGRAEDEKRPEQH